MAQTSEAGRGSDEPTDGTVVAILGAGVMGETLRSGRLRAGRSADELVVSERRPERVTELHERYGVRVLDNPEAAALAGTVVLVVKPQDMSGLLAEIRDHLRPGALVVSLAAGITTRTLQDGLPAGTPVVRVMPNTPARVDEGMAAICGGEHCDESHLARAEQLLRSCGKVIRIGEQHLDAVTAISTRAHRTYERSTSDRSVYATDAGSSYAPLHRRTRDPAVARSRQSLSVRRR
jgi:pyrroline-5-carboxylate reductase